VILGTALGTAFDGVIGAVVAVAIPFIAGFIKKRRVAAESAEADAREREEDWDEWRQETDCSLYGREATRSAPGSAGLMERVALQEEHSGMRPDYIAAGHPPMRPKPEEDSP